MYVCMRLGQLELSLTRPALNYYDLSVTDGTTKYDVTRSYTEIGGVNFIDSDGFPASDSPYYGLNSTDDISALREASPSPCIIYPPLWRVSGSLLLHAPEILPWF